MLLCRRRLHWSCWTSPTGECPRACAQDKPQQVFCKEKAANLQHRWCIISPKLPCTLPPRLPPDTRGGSSAEVRNQTIRGTEAGRKRYCSLAVTLGSPSWAMRSYRRAGLWSCVAVGIHKKEFVSFYPQVKLCLEDKFLFRMLTGETEVRAEPFQRKAELKQWPSAEPLPSELL